MKVNLDVVVSVFNGWKSSLWWVIVSDATIALLMNVNDVTVLHPLIFTSPLASCGMSECLIVLTRSKLFSETSLQWQTMLLHHECSSKMVEIWKNYEKFVCTTTSVSCSNLFETDAAAHSYMDNVFGINTLNK